MRPASHRGPIDGSALAAASSAWPRWVVVALAGCVLAIVAVTLLEYASGWNSGVDRMFFASGNGEGDLGRMSYNSVIGFSLISFGILASSAGDIRAASRPGRGHRCRSTGSLGADRLPVRRALAEQPQLNPDRAAFGRLLRGAGDRRRPFGPTSGRLR
jgi:hypothetical protein